VINLSAHARESCLVDGLSDWNGENIYFEPHYGCVYSHTAHVLPVVVIEHPSIQCAWLLSPDATRHPGIQASCSSSTTRLTHQVGSSFASDGDSIVDSIPDEDQLKSLHSSRKAVLPCTSSTPCRRDITFQGVQVGVTSSSSSGRVYRSYVAR
jgi:hypothetical protein